MGVYKSFDCVLLVDDDPLDVFLNAQLLSRLGIANTVRATSNALEAVKFIRQCCILEQEMNSMLIILNIDTSSCDGFEFLNLVNSMATGFLDKVAIIILSSSVSKEDMDRAKKYNVLGYIELPLTSEKLQEIIAKNFKATINEKAIHKKAAANFYKKKKAT